MRGDAKCQEDLVLYASSICGRVAVKEESLYQETAASLKVMEKGSIVMLCWFVCRMLMRVVPGARSF
jgi:hypothetical protein